jgi:hypothetical protein
MAKRSTASVASTPKTRYGIRNALTTADSSARDLHRTDEQPARAARGVTEAAPLADRRAYRGQIFQITPVPGI